MKKIMKKVIITLFLVMSLFIVSPMKTEALTSTNNSVIYMLDTDDDLQPIVAEEQDCDGTDNSLLGDPNDENSVAWLLQQILNFIKVLGPIFVVILSSIDFITVIVKSDDEAMGKAQKKLIKRLILAALLFFIPVLVQVLLDLFGMTSASTCGLK